MMSAKKLENVMTLRFADEELAALVVECAAARPIVTRAELIRVLVAEALATRKAARKFAGRSVPDGLFRARD